MKIYVKKCHFRIFFFFCFSNLILSDALILPVSQLQTQQVMTSQIRSHIVIMVYFFGPPCMLWGMDGQSIMHLTNMTHCTASLLVSCPPSQT